jgi:UDP-N-acetylmuramoyl-tripeptide--D-alanyl-D-alanine ligase
MQVSIVDLVKVCNGSCFHILDKHITDAVLDSRIVEIDNLFLVYTRDRQSAIAYIRQAVDKGAAAIMLSNEYLDMDELQLFTAVSFIFVEDVTDALSQIAHWYRNLPQHAHIKVIAITGSCGKTTVKELLRSICEQHFGAQYVLATFGNQNNQIGAPLTLLKMRAHHKVVIVELGMNHMHELHSLSCMVNPNIAVVNNVKLAHIAHFNSLTDIAIAKSEIYDGLMPNGLGFVNMQDQYADLWLKKLSANSTTIVQFGAPGTLCYIEHIREANSGFIMSVITVNNKFDVELHLLGEHNCSNALTAIALALEIGCTVSNMQVALSQFTAVAGRLVLKNGVNNIKIIDDTYNGNPDSVKAAIKSIKNFAHPRWLVLGSLAELDNPHVYYKDIFEFAAPYLDAILTIGDDLLSVTNDRINVMHFTDYEELVNFCRSSNVATLLVKGSHSMHMWDIVNGCITTDS